MTDEKTYYAGLGYIDKDSWQGPRTTYEDGTPIADFNYRNDWNRDWSTRVNDLYRIAGGQHGGSSRTTLRPGEEYATLTSPYWRTEAGRQFVNDMAIGDKPINEIYEEMVRLDNFSKDREAAKEEWARLRSGTANDSSADTSGGMMQGYQATFGNRTNDLNTAMRVANTGNYNWFRGGDRGDWMDINPNDKEAILAMYQEEGYNPYYGRHFNNKNYRRLNDALGRDVHKLGDYFDAYDNRRAGNMMDYLYAKTKDVSNFERDQTNRKFTQWMRDNNLSQKDLFKTRMNSRTYENMGLNEVLGDFDETYNPQFYTEQEKVFASRGDRGESGTNRPTTPRASSLFDEYMKERNL